ncbi:LamG domain-containing protein, partial [Candidatus Gracilibacteria bacterium]|nr:LamG domain-containing protein [Candidatus Gracilibacteria bacterium]
KDYDNSLVGYWDMETICESGNCGSGNDGKLKDLSGNGNDGIFDGGMVYANALTGGIVGKGLDFVSGSNNIINCGTGKSLEIENQITLIVIFKSRQNALKGVFTKQSADETSGCGIDGYCGYHIRTGINIIVGRSYDKTFNGYSSQDRSLPSKFYSYIDNFVHVAYTVKNSESGKIFINGNNLTNNSSNRKLGTLTKSQNPLLIGRYWNNSLGNIGYDYFNGIIDDIKIYNRALSDEEIKQHAKAAGF